MKTYSALISEFEPEGSLRDIYIFDTNKNLWNMLITHISKSTYNHEFWHGENELSLPNSFGVIKELQEINPTLLKIFLPCEIQVNCHFFTENQIEMDISPNEITNETKFNALTSFLKWISSTINKKVVLTHENSPEEVILSVEPKNV